MTSSRVKRVTLSKLPAQYGPDKDRQIVITFHPGNGLTGSAAIPDILELRPLRTRRSEKIAVLDVYRFALMCRINSEHLARAREKKAAKAARLARERQARAEKRLSDRARRDNQLG